MFFQLQNSPTTFQVHLMHSTFLVCSLVKADINQHGITALQSGLLRHSWGLYDTFSVIAR
jgi:hypothetical protein